MELLAVLGPAALDKGDCAVLVDANHPAFGVGERKALDRGGQQVDALIQLTLNQTDPIAHEAHGQAVPGVDLCVEVQQIFPEAHCRGALERFAKNLLGPDVPPRPSAVGECLQLLAGEDGVGVRLHVRNESHLRSSKISLKQGNLRVGRDGDHDVFDVKVCSCNSVELLGEPPHLQHCFLDRLVGVEISVEGRERQLTVNRDPHEHGYS